MTTLPQQLARPRRVRCADHSTAANPAQALGGARRRCENIGPHSGPYRAPRSGFTLVELLIVVTILIMLTVAAIPLLSSSTRGRQVREAARELSAYIAGARAKALETGRPAGIWLERFPPIPLDVRNDPAKLDQYVKGIEPTGAFHFCVNVYTAITPPPYSGDTLDSRVVVQNGQVREFRPATGWMGLVRRGDLMKLNYQGRLYQIEVIDPTKIDERGYLRANSLPWTLIPIDFVTDASVPNTPPTGVPFQILRQPVRSNDAPLQLPGTAVIDLDLSGLDSRPAGKVGEPNAQFPGSTFATIPNPGSGTPTIDTNPVIITFGAGGALDRVYYRGGQFIVPTEPVYLLVGRREKVYPGEPPEASDEVGVQFNFQDTGHWCLSLGHQTGRVTVTELAVFDNPDPRTGSNPLAKARHFARLAQSTGGR